MIIEDEQADMCPICKTDKYLSPNMNFLINPECYHKICESCVDRIFSLGPAPCPYPKCGKILRKNKFKQQVFDDLKIEKEVDIRRRVGAIYNKTEEDFKNLQEYNKYLEDTEEIIYNMSNGIDVEETEAKVNQYEQDHKIEILEKSMRESQKNSDMIKYQESMERLKQEKLKIQKQMEVEDVEYSKQQQQELLDKMTNSDVKSDELIKQQQSQMLKRTSIRRKQLQAINNQLDQSFNQQFQEVKEVVVPFTPFQGDRDLNKNYEIIDDYYDPFITSLAKNKDYLAGGWRMEAVFEKALSEAFMGLGCNIEKEKLSQKI